MVLPRCWTVFGEHYKLGEKKGRIYPASIKVLLTIKALFAVKYPYFRVFAVRLIMVFIFLYTYKIIV